MQQILRKAQQMQEKIAQKQTELEQQEVVGTSGGGMVSVVMTLKGKFQSVSIDQSVIVPNEKDLLEDLILAALNDAKEKGDHLFNSEMALATDGMEMPKIPGLF